MLLRHPLPEAHRRWNRVHGAPRGYRLARLVPRALRPWPVLANAAGPFAFQLNSPTREHEYPWAFEALQVSRGLRVLELGGGLSGLQFALSRAGCDVVNVDPGERARGRGWPVTPEFVAKLNQRFGTSVELRHGFIEEANLADESFDRAVSVSVLEHIPPPDLKTLLEHVRRALRPGALFVITLDLFLNVRPFTDAESNEYGTNIDVKWLVDESGLERIHGRDDELYGYAAFDPPRILAHEDQYVVSRDYPVMVQTLVLRKA